MGSIYEILLPESKDLEKYLYGRPTVNKDLDVIKFMNDNDQVVFTSESKFYYILKKKIYKPELYLQAIYLGSQL